MSKIGILGGAFDPPHKSHIDMARALMLERGYDQLVLLPSKNPPHKALTCPAEHRYNMLKLVAGKDMVVSKIEMEYDGIGYTCDYLPLLKEKYGEDIEYIIGGDSIANFDKWSRPLEILKQVKLLVVARDGDKEKCTKAIAKYDTCQKLGIELAEYTPSSMSSTDIRTRLRLGLSVEGLLDDKVLEYIREHNLYNEYARFHQGLKATLGEHRYTHSLYTTLFAVTHRDCYGLDYDKVFTAALLHDCAKYNVDIDSLREYALKVKPDMWREDGIGTPVAHAFLGYFVAMRDYGITDPEVLDAIYYHTTARADMTPLDKLIYMSDVLECSRDYEGVDSLRESFYRNPDVGFVNCLSSSYEHLVSKTNSIYPLTLEAYDRYLIKK